jgi:hypothetical protein
VTKAEMKRLYLLLGAQKQHFGQDPINGIKRAEWFVDRLWELAPDEEVKKEEPKAPEPAILEEALPEIKMPVVEAPKKKSPGRPKRSISPS